MKNIVVVSIICFICGGVVIWFLKPSEKCKTETKTEYIKGDSIPYYVKVVSPPVIREMIAVKLDTLFLNIPVDTFALLSQYFEIINYNDTIKQDSSFIAYLRETVTQNRIIKRELLMQNNRVKTINNTIVQQPGVRYMVGVFAGTNSFGVEGQYLKNNRSYGVFYDAKNKSVGGKIMFNLKK